jgi:SH3-like domain-containing protein
VLNVREFPTSDARIVGVIPPDGRGIVPTGERNGNWVFVRYRRVEGWVSRRFVYPGAPPVRRGGSLDPDVSE